MLPRVRASSLVTVMLAFAFLIVCMPYGICVCGADDDGCGGDGQDGPTDCSHCMSFCCHPAPVVAPGGGATLAPEGVSEWLAPPGASRLTIADPLAPQKPPRA